MDANTRITYNSSTNDRDVNDYVTNISPKDTPVFSLFGQTGGVARQKETVTDSNQAANADNAAVEGASLSNSTTNDRSVENNWMQIFTKVIEVSGTQEAVIKFGGVKSEIKYQTIKSYKELAQDVEKALVVGASASGASGTARKMNGLVNKITTNTATAASANAQWTGTATADYIAFEDLMLDLFQTMYDAGQTPDTVFCAGRMKRRISRLSTKLTTQINAEAKKQIMVTSTYESDFGEVTIILERYVPSTTMIAVSKDMFRVAYLRRFKQFELAKVADATRVAVVGECTLDCDTEKAGGTLKFQ